MRHEAAAASLPLWHDGRPVAGLVFLWNGGHPYPEAEQQYLSGLAALAGRRFRYLARAAGTAPAPGHWLQGVLDALPVAAFLLAPVRDERGEVVDFLIDYASPPSGETEPHAPA